MNTADFPPDEGSAAQQVGKPTPDEEWQMNVRAVRVLSRAGNWSEVLKLLRNLSTKHQNPEVYKALGQQVWVALKSEAPAIDVVQALFHWLNTLGPAHELAGHVAALANLVVEMRTPDHPEQGLAQGQAQQMFSLVCDTLGIEGREEFDAWVQMKHLDDPDQFVPVVMEGLEWMIGEGWWIDRQALHREMEQANAKVLQSIN